MRKLIAPRQWVLKHILSGFETLRENVIECIQNEIFDAPGRLFEIQTNTAAIRV